MNQLILIISRWILSKAATLIIIIGILIACAWGHNQWLKIKALHEMAEQNDALAKTIEQELEPINAQIKVIAKKTEAIGTELKKQTAILTDKEELESQAKQKLEDYENKEQWYYNRMTHSWYYDGLSKAKKSLEDAINAVEKYEDKIDSIKKELSTTKNGRELTKLVAQRSEKEKSIIVLNDQSLKIRSEVAQEPMEKIRSAVLSVLPSALGVLALIILTPVAIKAFLYFVIAPLVSKTKPVILVPDSDGEFQISQAGVSVSVELEPDDELIVHSAFLQSGGSGPGRKTRWLLSWRMPFTSLAAGLYAMVSVRNKKGNNPQVTISPKKELFDKLSRIEVAEGSSMVIYPRSLVGIIMKNGEPPKLERHWRIFNLHSWVTFQFRYLVIHGECQIIMKGCRGIRAERVAADNPRMQDQLATLGFTTNLAYSSSRCETFTEYLLGRDELFNDKFSGSDGIYLTEEIHNPQNNIGPFGRGIEGLIDGVLKGFGI